MIFRTNELKNVGMDPLKKKKPLLCLEMIQFTLFYK
jgi:hypothetical protein